MICNYCGGYYESKDSRKKYCSEECSRKRQRKAATQLARERKLKTTNNNKAVDEINKKAYEKGISYGQYVARYGE